MDAGSILAFLQCLHGQHITNRGKWVVCSCPLAPWLHDSGKDTKPSFAISVKNKEQSHYTCFVCKNGKLDDLVLELMHLKAGKIGYDLKGAWDLARLDAERKLDLVVKDWGEEEAVAPECIIPESWLATFPKAWPVPYAREYLQSRMVSEEISNDLDIRWDRHIKTVCFPVRNHDGKLVSMRGRRIAPTAQEPPYHVYSYLGKQSGQAWLGEHSTDWDQPILLVESVFDMTSVLRVYKNVLAPLSVGINKQRVQRLSKATEVVTYFDQGAGGNKARDIVKTYLGTAMVAHIIPTGKDPGEMQEAAIRDQLELFLKLLPKSSV